MDSNALIGKRCDWRIIKIMKHDWQLSCDGNIVATLTAKRWLSGRFEGSYENVKIEISYSRSLDSSTITNSNTGEPIGVIVGLTRLKIEGFKIPEPAQLKINGKTYNIILKKNLGYSLLRADGAVIAVTDVDAHSTPVRSAFTLLTIDERPVNVWLLAIASHYYAINHAFGSV